MAKQKYYVVWKGRKPGIYNTWAECESQVKGFTDAQYKAFESRPAAEAAFRGVYEDYKGKPGTAQQWLFSPTKPDLPSICVDAACSGSPGVLEYRGGVARAGDWIYEPNGAEHEATHHPEETVYLANVHGAIAFYGDDKQIVGLSDWRAMKAIQDIQKR